MFRIITTGVLAVYISIGSLAVAEETIGEAEQIDTASSLMLREPAVVAGYMSLPLGGQSIDATFLEQTLGKKRGNVLILSEYHAEIDGADIVQGLRTKLPEAGWTTMTIALHYPAQTGVFISANNEARKAENKASAMADNEPSADKQRAATIQNDSDVVNTTAINQAAVPISNAARLIGAVSYLQARSPGKLAIVAIGESVDLLAAEQYNMAELDGVIWINAKQAIASVPYELPVLDIVPERDNLLNQVAVQRRAAIIRDQKPSSPLMYTQRRVVGANQAFTGYNSILLFTVRSWLNKQFSGE